MDNIDVVPPHSDPFGNQAPMTPRRLGFVTEQPACLVGEHRMVQRIWDMPPIHELLEGSDVVIPVFVLSIGLEEFLLRCEYR